MSDKELYKILEGFRTASDEEVYKEIQEGETQIEKQGDKTIVTDPEGNKQEIQQKGNDVLVTQDGDTTRYDQDSAEEAGILPDEEMNEEVEEETEEAVNEEQLDEILPAIAAAGGALARTAATAAGTSFGASAADKVFGESEDEPEYSTFDAENPSHRKCLQRGTPVVLTPEVCSDPKGDRTGVFVNLGKSGFYGKVIRNCDGREIKVHLSDIVSADITNNSIYESLNDQFEAVMEEITVTTTTNPENPENDTTTITGVGADAVDELAAIMANAGLERDYEAPRDAEVDDGMPQSDEPVYMEPEVELDPAMTGEPQPGEEELMGRDQLAAGAGCMEDTVMEDDIQHLDPALGKAIADGADIYDIMNSEATPQKDREILQREYDEIAAESGYHPDDDFESIFEVMAQRIFDMYGDGNMFPEESVEEERDVQHANTPDEEFARLEALIQGMAGGLNKPKKMYKKEYPGDNNMAVEEGETEYDDEEARRPSGTTADEKFKGPNYELDPASGLGHDEELDETESFLSLYKTFTGK